MPTVLELQEQRAQTWSRLQEIVDGAEAENRDLSAEEQTGWDAGNAAIAALDKRIERQRVLEATPAREPDARNGARQIERAIAGPERTVRATATPEYRSAFLSFMRGGRTELSPEERAILREGYATLDASELRALGVNVATAGGYLVPEDSSMMGAIEQAKSFFGGMREVAQIVRTDSGAELPIPTGNDTTNTGRILNENTSVTETDATVGARVLKAYMYSSDLVRVSFQLLQDAAFDIETWLGGLLGERIGRITNTHFTTGVGVDEPRGITLDSVQGRQGATGQTTTVTFDDLIILEHAVNIAYRRRPGVRWMMHDQTLREIRRLKDGEGRFLWQPGVGTGAPDTILGYRYVINNDVATMAASAIAVVFGALDKYMIRDVSGIRLLRLEERYADVGQVAFVAFSRHDGALIDAGTNPVQHYANAAS